MKNIYFDKLYSDAEEELPTNTEKDCIQFTVSHTEKNTLWVTVFTGSSNTSMEMI